MGSLVTVDSDLWYDELAMHAPGATAKGMKQALSSALRMFCQRSGAWVVELWDVADGVPVPFTAAGRFLDLQARLETKRAAEVAELVEGATCPPYTSGDATAAWDSFHILEDYWPWDVLYIHGMTYYEMAPGEELPYKGTPLTPLQTPQSRSVYHAAEPPRDGPPREYRTFVERPGVVELLPPMAATEGVSGVVPFVAMQVPMNCCTSALPVIFQRYWYDVILDGALAVLYAQPDKPYTNFPQAEYRARAFKSGISTARDMARRQMGNAETQWQFPKWA
jgi:hypothetical protein